MFQWFPRFPEFVEYTEFSESSASFKENSQGVSQATGRSLFNKLK